MDGDTREPIDIAKDKNIMSIENDGVNVDNIIRQVLDKNKSVVDNIKKTGKDGQVNFLVGQAMKELKK